MTPDGWKSACLRDLATYIGRGTAPKYAPRDTGVFAVSQKCIRDGRVTVRHCRPHEPDAPVKAQSRLRAGDVCVNSTGTGTAGRVGLWSGEHGEANYFIDTHVTVVRGLPHAVDSKFLVEALLSPAMQRLLEADCFSGSTNQIELNKSAFANLELLLPPLSEQQKIAAILSALDNAIESTQAVIGQLQVLKKAMIAEFLTRGLPGRHTRFKQTEIGEIPKEWEVTSIEHLCSHIVDCPHETPDCTVDGYPVIRTADVIPGRILLAQARRVSAETYAKRTRRLQPAPGDVLYSREGERYGIAAPVPLGVQVCLGQRMMQFRASAETDPSFLCWLLNSPQVYQQAKDEVGGSTSPHVNIKSIRGFVVARPTLSEQQKIGTVINALRTREAAEDSIVALLQFIKAALISILLTGELRVTPDEATL